ncbi:serine/threonine-protein kinase [Mycobacterium sp. IDR2000157661]|uniref:serine/threonine-protein kinase n=1 Tax=Mycobacterium sp. IDR2000157661 TaxID=2867005 RepID=UPI001EEC526C|nr:serine/threonine-protein kinase [Mycobacterium sp. IDR2000157661]ULE32021.1 serine/threonine protein kinase [Mycobacterium sp. IDR2000157661]
MPVDATSIPAAIADYRILGMIGQGNHGRFYLAEPPDRLGLAADRVALKVFHAAVDADAYRRGVRELRAFAAVRSPRLVEIYDVVLEENFFYAMEYFPLGSLALPARELSRTETLRALEDAARAVHELHEHGLVHGDVKPANVMVAADGGRLSDLGLARVFEEAQGNVTSFAPTASVEFTDPDLLQGEAQSRASDIFSLGATINRALSGEGLYGELPLDQPMLAIRAVVSGKARVSVKLRKAEAALVQRCIGPDDARPATAAEVADGIAALT